MWVKPPQCQTTTKAQTVRETLGMCCTAKPQVQEILILATALFLKVYFVHVYISVTLCKAAVTPVLMHWSYCSLALSHQFVTVNNHFILPWASLLTIYFHSSGCSSPPSAAYMHQWIGSALVQIMAYHIFAAKPLSKPVLDYYKLDPNFSEILIIIQNFHSRKCTWKYHLQIGGNFVQGEMSQSLPFHPWC